MPDKSAYPYSSLGSSPGGCGSRISIPCVRSAMRAYFRMRPDKEDNAWKSS